MLCVAVSPAEKNTRTHSWAPRAENRPLRESIPCVSVGGSLTEASGRAANGETTSQTRKLRLRKAHFKGAAVPPRNFTPPSHNGGSGDFGYDADGLVDVDSAPLDVRKQKEGAKPGIPDGTGLLQEVSNSSMRRRKKNDTHERTPPSGSTSADHQASPNPLASLYLCPDVKKPSFPANLADATYSTPVVSLTGRLEDTGERRAQAKTTRPISCRQFISDHDTTQYIEHLESQLVAMETQLNSLGSPNSIKSRSAKLMALTAESKVLRQEVTDWEQKFEERVHEQVEEHENIIRSLKAQVKLVQKASDRTNENLKLMEVEAQGMRQQIESVERLNQDLERRVELMSDLLATSPTRMNFEGPSLQSIPQRHPSKPTSRILPVCSLPHSSTSPCGNGNRQASPGSPTLYHDRELGDQDASACLVQPATYRASSMDLGSETSQQTLINEEFTSPDRRRYTGHFFQSDNETKIRPTRRMRRFYTGSTGPKALILPVTAQSGPSPASAPVTAASTPTLSTQTLEGFPLPAFVQSNKFGPSQAQPLPTSQDTDNTAERTTRAEDTSSTPPKPLPFSFPAQLTTPPNHPAADSDSVRKQSSAGRDSVTSAHGETLFQELIRVKSRDDRSEQSEIRSPEVSKPAIPPDLPNAPEKWIKQDLFHTRKKFLDSVSGADILYDPQELLPESRFPLRVLGRLTAAAYRSIDYRAPRIKYFLISAWSMLTLSRPVLEFRWWLVTLLVGGLRKRHASSPLLHRPQAVVGSSLQPALKRASGFGCDGALDSDSDSEGDGDETGETGGIVAGDRCGEDSVSRHPPSYESDSAIWDIFETRDKYKHAIPPPVSWLKFSITLVFAVGIAIKDGPASLFRARGGQRRQRPSPVQSEAAFASEGGALDSDDDDYDDY